MARRRFVPTSVLLSLAFAGAVVSAEAPVTVSPGSVEGTVISETCPTFNWGAVVGAKSYELVVYQVPSEQDEVLTQDDVPVLQVTLPGSANGWTPALDQCLERGSRYAWSIRVVGPTESMDWSQPKLLRVAAGGSEEEFREALAVVKRYLAKGEPDVPGARSPVDLPALGGGRQEAREPVQDTLGVTVGVAISGGGITIGGLSVLTVGKTVFLTSTTTGGGNFGGLSEADIICRERAEAAGLSGSFKAWLSASACGPASPCRSFTQSAGPYIRVDGVRIADNWTDLTDGSLLAPIDRDEFGQQSGSALVHTGTTVGGAPSGNDCLDWSSGNPLDSFTFGSRNATDSQWTLGFGGTTCANGGHFYCFEQ